MRLFANYAQQAALALVISKEMRTKSVITDNITRRAAKPT